MYFIMGYCLLEMDGEVRTKAAVMVGAELLEGVDERVAREKGRGLEMRKKN